MWEDGLLGSMRRLDGADASSWIFFKSSNLKGAGFKEPTPFCFQISAASLVQVGKTTPKGVSQPALKPFSVVVHVCLHVAGHPRSVHLRAHLDEQHQEPAPHTRTAATGDLRLVTGEENQQL